MYKTPLKEKFYIFLLLMLAGYGFAFTYSDQTQDNSALINTTPTPQPTKLGSWLDNLDDKKIAELQFDYGCSYRVLGQIEYFNNENLSDKFTFEKYKVSDLLKSEPKDLDINSNLHAREFRTMIRSELEREGINFAGHYSIVSVGMTGMPGPYYWIVNRANGKAYTFPYSAYYLDFKEDSSLIVMDSKQVFLDIFKRYEGFAEYCDSKPPWDFNYEDSRPFYFLWEDNKLKLLGPTDIKPPVNWRE